MQEADMFEPLRQYPECQDFLKTAIDSGWLADDVAGAVVSGTIPDEILFDNLHAQELICLYQLTVWEKLKNLIAGEKLFAGYSLGEPVAYGVAGFLAPEAVFKMIMKRAEIMSSCVKEPCSMLAVKGLSEDDVKAKCEQAGCHIAIYNPGRHFICGGLEKGIEVLEKECVQAGAEKVMPLKINVPSHTPLLSGATEEFRKYLETCGLKMDTETIMLEGVSGRRIFTRMQAVNALANQLSHPVMWARNISAMIEYGCGVCLELGPGHALARMTGEMIHYGEARSIEEFSDLNELSKWLRNSIIRNR